jgi:uridylate kinase
MKMDTVVISLGGSIIVPEQIDTRLLRQFRDMVLRLEQKRFVIICGGGGICRKYQHVARGLAEVPKADLDWIGIQATRLNAELVRSMFGSLAHGKVIHDPDAPIDTDRRIIIGAGFRPGSSTDLRAVQLAERFGAGHVINMSNIDYVYSADPKKDPGARQLTRIAWSDFRRLVGDAWDPGLSMPFDPIASQAAEAMGLEVIIIGNDIQNLERVLTGETFKGTTIG